MKKFISISAFLLLFSVYTTVHAQDKMESVGKDIKSGAQKAGQAIKKGAKTAGTKTAEIASKGKARVTDEVHKDKVGPNGETIYIDNHSKYYWVDEKGRRHYVTDAELKDKNS